MIDLKGRKVAVVGVSDNPEKFGFKIFRDLEMAGFDPFAVGVRGGSILGREVFRSLGELPEKPDLVVTVVPPAATEKTVEECISLGVKEIWMQPGSDSEQAIEKAGSAGMKVTHHACIMVEAGIW